MSAETLRRAAGLMRERAEAATPSDGIQWGDGKGYSPLSYARQNDAEHIASWHPAVALAVADWLDAEAGAHFHVGAPDADGISDVRSVYDLPGMDRSPAMKVARAYLGESA